MFSLCHTNWNDPRSLRVRTRFHHFLRLCNTHTYCASGQTNITSTPPPHFSHWASRLIRIGPVGIQRCPVGSWLGGSGGVFGPGALNDSWTVWPLRLSLTWCMREMPAYYLEPHPCKAEAPATSCHQSHTTPLWYNLLSDQARSFISLSSERNPETSPTLACACRRYFAFHNPWFVSKPLRVHPRSWRHLYRFVWPGTVCLNSPLRLE